MQSFVREGDTVFVTRWTGWPATLITYENSAGSDGARCPYRLCEGKLYLHWRRFTHVESVAECHDGRLGHRGQGFCVLGNSPRARKDYFPRRPASARTEERAG